MTIRLPQITTFVQILEGKASGSLSGIWHAAVEDATLKIGLGEDHRQNTVFKFPTSFGTAGQFLAIGSGGEVEWSTPAGAGDVSGPSGSVDNAVARFDGATGKLLQNSNVFVTDGAGVGINISTPSGGITNTLHIADDHQTNVHYDDIANLIVENNDARVQIISEDLGSQASTIFLTNVPSSGDNKHWSIHAQGVSRQDRFDIAFQRTSAGPTTLDGTAYFTITTDGRTGIGTTSPDGTTKLHLASGSAGSVTANANAMLIVERSTTAYINILTPDANNSGILFGTPTSAQHGGILYFPTTNNMQFRLNSNLTWMEIVSPGDLRINLRDEREGGLRIIDNEASTSQFAHIYYSSGATPVDGQLKLYVDSTTPLMVLDDAQRVGIGIGAATPVSKLHVQDSKAGIVRIVNTAASATGQGAFIDLVHDDGAAISSGHRIGGIGFRSTYDTTNEATAGTIVAFADGTWTSTSYPTRIQLETTPAGSTVRSPRLTVDSTGFIGIGDTTPQVLLEILGSDSGTTSTDGICRMQNTSTTTGKTILNLNYSNDSTLGTTDYQIVFRANESLVGGIHSEVVYAPFTAAHYCSFPMNAKRGSFDVGSASFGALTGSQYVSGSPEIAPGMVVYSTGEMCFSSSLENALPKVNVATASADKRVFGVYAGYVTSEFLHCSGTEMYAYQGVGEGGILVTDQSGNIEAGDLLMSSDQYGHAVKQPDDIIRNYTIAKATEDIDFSSMVTSSVYGFKSQLLGCTYLCG